MDDTKVGNRVPAHAKRQGGHATNWNIPGITNYTPTAVRMQCGSVEITIADIQMGGYVAVTFPIAFSAIPNVFVTWGVRGLPLDVYAVKIAEQVSASVVTIGAERSGLSGEVVVEVRWLAIGPE